MRQTDFFAKPEPREPSKMARREDPKSSHAAARKYEEKRGASDRNKVLVYVKDNPGLNAKEIDRALGLTETARKRLPELREDGFVFSTQEGTNMQRWWHDAFPRNRFPSHVVIRCGKTG